MGWEDLILDSSAPFLIRSELNFCPQSTASRSALCTSVILFFASYIFQTTLLKNNSRFLYIC